MGPRQVLLTRVSVECYRIAEFACDAQHQQSRAKRPVCLATGRRGKLHEKVPPTGERSVAADEIPVTSGTFGDWRDHDNPFGLRLGIVMSYGSFHAFPVQPLQLLAVRQVPL